MRIAHFGTFDAENYGDMLFPKLLERRLAGLGAEVVHVAPAGGPPVWEDCVPTVGFDDFLETVEAGADVAGVLDGVVVGGGQVVRTAPTSLEVYDRGGLSAFTTYPSVWLGAAYVAARRDAPLCWNAPGVSLGVSPGVSSNFSPEAARLVRWTASVTDYLAVRDETSRRTLVEAGVTRDISVAPDTAAEVSGLWDEVEVSAAYREAFARNKRPVPGRTLAFHVNSRWAGEELSAVAARIDRISETLDAAPILLAVGPCHGDGEVQRRLSREMRSDPLVIDRPRSLLEVTACIARSHAYFGSSLHGMIAACAFGTRGVLVASGKDNKYAGFLDQLGLSSWLVGSWAEAEQKTRELSATPGDSWKRALHTALPVLDEHWDRLRETLLSGRKPVDGVCPPSPGRRAAIKQLRRTSEERHENLHIFGPLISENLDEFRETRKNLLLLRRWMQNIDEATRELWASRRWKTGEAAGELWRRALRRPREWGAREQLDSQLQRFRDWDKEFGRHEENPPGDDRPPDKTTKPL